LDLPELVHHHAGRGDIAERFEGGLQFVVHGLERQVSNVQIHCSHPEFNRIIVVTAGRTLRPGAECCTVNAPGRRVVRLAQTGPDLDTT
jgi:hypothetical protein